jgi:uncharacterized delta-60 repeat protein
MRARAAAVLLACIGVALALGSVAPARPNGLAVDSSVARAPSSVDTAYAVATERDGKVVVAGVSGNRREGRRRMALARYTARGRLDRSFGVGGKALTSFGAGNNSEARAAAIQADGKIVLAGSLRPSNGRVGFALARYTKRGRLDSSFGQGGKVVTRFGAGRGVSEASALAIQPDSKVVAVGSWYRSPINGPVRFALARYTSRGRLDPSFGRGGKVLTTFGPRSHASARGVLIQPDGRLVVVGDDLTDTRREGYSAVALARYHADGTLDRSFGPDGRVVTKLFEYGANAGAAVLERDGKVVVNASDAARSFLVRYSGDGKLDPSFGVGGKAVASRRVLPLLALQRGGKFIVAGSVIARHGRAFYLRRCTQKGDVDSSFGRSGKVFTDFGSPAVANALAVQANGPIVVAGTRGFTDFAVARYTSSGQLDGSFGAGGRVTTDFGSVRPTR